MIRYTLEIGFDNNKHEQDDLLQHLEECLLRSKTPIKIRHIEKFHTQGVIFIETNILQNRLFKLIDDLGCVSIVDVIKIYLGWIVPQGLLRQNLLEEKEYDPLFYSVPVPKYYDNEKVYTYSLIGKIFSLLNIVFLFFGISMLYVGYTTSEKVPVWLGLFIIVIFAFSILNMLRNIKCDSNGIVFNYLLKPEVKMRWSDIGEIRIYQARGEWYSIRSKNKIVKLPLPRIYDKTTRNIILKSIIIYGRLCFVESSSNGILYQRAIKIK